MSLRSASFLLPLLPLDVRLDADTLQPVFDGAGLLGSEAAVAVCHSHVVPHPTVGHHFHETQVAATTVCISFGGDDIVLHPAFNAVANNVRAMLFGAVLSMPGARDMSHGDLSGILVTCSGEFSRLRPPEVVDGFVAGLREAYDRGYGVITRATVFHWDGQRLATSTEPFAESVTREDFMRRHEQLEVRQLAAV